MMGSGSGNTIRSDPVAVTQKEGVSAMPADVNKAYVVAIIFVAVGLIWMMVGQSAGGQASTVALGLTAAGGLGIIAAAFTSIRKKRRDAKAGAAED